MNFEQRINSQNERIINNGISFEDIFQTRITCGPNESVMTAACNHWGPKVSLTKLSEDWVQAGTVSVRQSQSDTPIYIPSKQYLRDWINN